MDLTLVKLLRRFCRGWAILLVALPAFSGCATQHDTAVLGDYKIIYGPMSPATRHWESFKASATGWETVGTVEDEECSVLVLHK